ncbi:MAG: hypothetical protein JNM89_10415 [Hyphomicrobiaceae bacterium]|nr:hypothetical protein [Hyphomicrobiaceae bacterium]
MMSCIRGALRAAVPLAAALLISACGGVPLGWDQPASSLHDINLLTRYGTAIQTPALSKDWRKGLEQEIQSRNLLNAQDVMIIEQRLLRGGASMAATLASVHFLPSAFGVSKRHRGVEVIVIDSGLYQSRQPDMFFFQNGRLIGWYYTTMDNNGNVHRTSNGQTFNIDDFEVTPCQKLGDSPCSGLQIPRLASATQ